MLTAQLLQATSYRIGFSDIRGDGRPDYRYHARILYGDTVTPARASVAGGTPLTIAGLGFETNTRLTIGNLNTPALAIGANQIVLSAPAQPDGVQNISLVDPPTAASSVLTGALTFGAGPDDILTLIPSTNPGTPIGGQAPNPIGVQVLASDGVTPVPGASVFLSSSPAVTFSACSGGATCTVASDQSGRVTTFVTLLTAGANTLTAQLAPASYNPPQQVQTTVVGTSSALDIALAPQTAHVLQGTTTNLTLTARVLSNGAPLGGRSVNFQVLKGSAGLSSPTVITNTSGYASTTVELSAVAGDVQVSACVAPGNSPCLNFYGTAVPASGLQLQAVAGGAQVEATGQSFLPVMVRVTDLATPPNSILGANVVFQVTIERSGDDAGSTSGGDTTITRPPTPIVLSSSQTVVVSDANGLASLLPSNQGFVGALEILGTATVASSQVPFVLQMLPPMTD